ncbi:hypothetical protein EVAR_96247_1 [Eumeta japonica]|uniref:Uncharacterized protein n=1 Tax=Eumeta variegata TaxID=151549 RepID=A0A4C1WK75_EUMVA|nr:hypothetical protein EVAR_96247_1 [Eumeta japonica]
MVYHNPNECSARLQAQAQSGRQPRDTNQLGRQIYLTEARAILIPIILFAVVQFIAVDGAVCGREIDASQAERLGRSCLSIARSALSLARSAQAERDNESCFFVRAAGVDRFIRRYHVKKYVRE